MLNSWRLFDASLGSLFEESFLFFGWRVGRGVVTVSNCVAAVAVAYCEICFATFQKATIATSLSFLGWAFVVALWARKYKDLSFFLAFSNKLYVLSNYIFKPNP